MLNEEETDQTGRESLQEPITANGSQLSAHTHTAFFSWKKERDGGVRRGGRRRKRGAGDGGGGGRGKIMTGTRLGWMEGRMMDEQMYG